MWQSLAFGLVLGLSSSSLLALPKVLVLGTSSLSHTLFKSSCCGSSLIAVLIFHLQRIFGDFQAGNFVSGCVFLLKFSMSKVRFSFDFLIRVRCHYVLLMVSIEIHRNSDEQNSEFRLKEDDILRAARMILPFTNLAISKLREVFSGEPSMTLKVITQTS